MTYYEEDYDEYQLAEHHEALDEIILKVVEQKYATKIKEFEEKARQNKILVNKNITLKEENKKLKEAVKASPFKHEQRIREVYAICSKWCGGTRIYSFKCPACGGTAKITKKIDGEIFTKTCAFCSHGSISSGYNEFELKAQVVNFDGYSVGNFGERILFVGDKNVQVSFNSLVDANNDSWRFLDKEKAEKVLIYKNEYSKNKAIEEVNKKLGKIPTKENE